MFSSKHGHWAGYPRRAILSDVLKTLSWCLSKATVISSIKAVGDLIACVYSDEFVQLNTARFNVYLRSRTLLMIQTRFADKCAYCITYQTIHPSINL